MDTIIIGNIIINNQWKKVLLQKASQAVKTNENIDDFGFDGSRSLAELLNSTTIEILAIGLI